MIYDLWPTPIGVYQIGDDVLNQQLVEAMQTQATHSNSENLWGHPHPAYQDLGKRMIDCANEVIQKRHMPAQISLGRAWLKSHGKGDINTPHAHSRNLLVGVYYIQAPEHCGDLLLQDPNAGTAWSDAVEDGKDCRSYIRIQPQAGMAVIFPGYIVHSVEPNQSDIRRICVATNFYDKPFP